MREQFTFSQFNFEMSAVDELHLPEYKGSTLRGAFGHAFKKVVCTLRTKECRECILKERCVYSYVFETPPTADTTMMRKYPAAPHPFVILPPVEDTRVYRKGENFAFILTLIGKATEYIPYFIYTFNELGNMGIGKVRGKYELKRICTFNNGSNDECTEVYRGDGTIQKAAYQVINWEEVADSVKGLNKHEITLMFKTPTRIKYQEDLVLDLEFHILIRSLLRRISALSYFHCGGELNVDFRGIIHDAEKVETKKRSLAWQDWERYSNRQETKMKMGGFVGEITFQGDLEQFLPFITLGEYIHVGKGTSFGLGKYKIYSERCK
jgi:CRISPR-associated endoribonuclease Cas6